MLFKQRVITIRRKGGKKTISKREQRMMNQKWHKWVRGAQIKRSKTAAKPEKGRPKIYIYKVLKKNLSDKLITNYKF